MATNELPSKVLLFKKGINDTTKGPFLFDEKSAKLVMAAYKKHAVQLMFDKEHLSTKPSAPNYNSDAQAWAELEVIDGDLYATDVKWTPEGQERLTNKKQRYLSPCFGYVLPKDGGIPRVVSIINVAITSMPATDGAQALVAASDHAQDDDDSSERGLTQTVTLPYDIVQSSLFKVDMAKKQAELAVGDPTDAPPSPEELAQALADCQAKLAAALAENEELKKQLVAEEDPAADESEEAKASEEATVEAKDEPVVDEEKASLLAELTNLKKTRIIESLSAAGVEGFQPANHEMLMEVSLSTLEAKASQKHVAPQFSKQILDAEVKTAPAYKTGVLSDVRGLTAKGN